MINLLPQKNKEVLREEEIWKIILILGVNLFLALVCFSLILYIIVIFISAEINVQKIIYQQKKKDIEIPEIQLLEKNLIAFNQTLSNLDYFYQNQFRSVEIMEEIAMIIPSDIYLTDLSLKPSPDKENYADCSLVGFALDRDTLIRFIEDLQKKENFKDIDSTASWTVQRDVNFRISFKISQN